MSDGSNPSSELGSLGAIRDAAMRFFERETRPEAALGPVARGPWPQPSPWFPDAMPPAVLAIPRDEREDWRDHVRARYERQILPEAMEAARWAFAHPGLAPVSDERFVEILGDGPIARFLTPVLDAPDRRLFARVMRRAEHRGAAFWKADFRVMELVASDAESRAASTVVLFARDRESRLTIAAIAVDERVFEPDASASFAVAKYFALQSAGVAVTLHMHPRLHFPFDALNAIARTRLPDGHVLKELLRPHLRLELAVADAVLHGERSVLVPGQIYSPYPGTHEETLRLVQSMWVGHPHRDGTPNSAYPPFTYPVKPPKVHARYGEFLGRYHAAVRAFVADVLATLPAGDEAARDFARHASHFLPGFPTRNTERDRREFVDAIATMIFSVSIAHTTDHQLYGLVNPREVPFRLRADVPEPGTDFALDRESLVTTTDTFQYKLCSKMYFEPYPIDRLVDVHYRFADPGLSARFVASLRAVEAGLERDGIPVYLGLDAMAPSVQF